MGISNSERRPIAWLIAVIGIGALLVGVILSSEIEDEWRVTDDGFLEYPTPTPEYRLISSEALSGSNLSEVRFSSRGAEVAGLLRIPEAQPQQPGGIPGVVLLPGATINKEQEQGLAELLSGLGYASIALDQRNLGGVDMRSDLETFLEGQEPTE